MHKDAGDLNVAGENVENDMPEDLSVQYKSVSVQTDKCHQDRFGKLFDVFSQNQIKSLMDSLLKFVLENDNESIDGLELHCRDNFKKVATIS